MRKIAFLLLLLWPVAVFGSLTQPRPTVGLSQIIRVGNVGSLSTVPGMSGATTFVLLTNPGGYFSIVGTELVAASNTPAGNYTVSIQASGAGITTVSTTITLHYAGTPTGNYAALANGNYAALANGNRACLAGGC